MYNLFTNANLIVMSTQSTNEIYNKWTLALLFEDQLYSPCDYFPLFVNKLWSSYHTHDNNVMQLEFYIEKKWDA